MARITGSAPIALIAAASAALLFGPSARAASPVVTVSNNAIVNFTYAAGAAAPDPQNVVISADQPTQVQATSTAYPGQPSASWLTILPPNGSLPLATPATLMAYVNPAGLAAGSYVAQVTFTMVGPVDPSSILSFSVFLTVTGAGGSGGGTNFGETMTVAPTALAFAFQPGSNLPPNQTLSGDYQRQRQRDHNCDD